MVVELIIDRDDPGAEDVRALLQRHLEFSREVTPAGHVHALEIESLRDPAVTFFSARSQGVLVGVGAIKQLTPAHAELKSMHTSHSARRQGVGRAMVEHLLSVARQQGYRRVSLETGTGNAFAPAGRLYATAGFTPCEPFAEYTRNPYSTCMTIELVPTEPPVTPEA